MLVIIKSAPGTPEGKRGINLACDMAADVCLMQNAVYFAHDERLESFCGAVYVLDDDCTLRGLSDSRLKKSIKKLDYDSLVDVIVNEDKIIGAF